MWAGDCGRDIANRTTNVGQKMNCKRCNRVNKVLRRGLCKSCWTDPEIRVKYGRARYTETRPISHEDPTEAELDALIASRYATMPGRRESEE